MSNHENPETGPEWPADAVPVQPEPEAEPTLVEPAEETVVEPAVADPEAADAEVVEAEFTDPEAADAAVAGAEFPDEELDAQVVDADVVDVEPEAPQPEPPVSTLALGEEETAPPAGTDFSVDQPAAVATPAAAPYAPPTAGGSFLDLPPMPDLPFTLPPAPGPAQAQPAPSYPRSSDYPPAQSGTGPYGNQGPYGAPGPYAAPGSSAPGGGYYGEQSAAQAYGHGARPAASYEQPAPAPFPQPDQHPSYGTPTGYGLAPYQSAGGDTTTASMAHWLPLVVSLVSSGTLGFLAPLIIMQTKGQRDPFVRANATESLNFNLTVLIGLIASLVLMLVAVGVIGLFVIPIVAIILQILGAIAASRGEVYRYPISIRFVK